MEDRIEFLGELPHEKAMRYMAICDVFSLPSWKEGFGIVYLEAMAHGKPVIACATEGIADIIEDGNTGFLAPPRSVEGLANIIDFTLNNPQKTGDIANRGRKLVLENYTWAKNAEKYIELYQEHINKV